MYLPTTRDEIKAMGWDAPDIILVTGDTYIDSPFIGTAVIGKFLMKHGFRVGVIAQPGLDAADDIRRLGEPKLFWGVTAGSVDSMVANYTALKKKRRSDDYTPGGVNNQRPDRASIAYTNLIRQHFKPCRPIVLGGIEASLRRIAHFDFWSNRIRRSILFDAKADYLIFGMARQSILDLAKFLAKTREEPSSNALHNDMERLLGIRGLGFISKTPPAPAHGYEELPSFDQVKHNTDQLIHSFDRFYRNTDPITAKGLVQAHGDRFLVLNPPEHHPSQTELDEMYDLAYERDVHPYYRAMGPVRAMNTIRFSIPTHQGCYGECHFCAIGVHQGRTVTWRSEASILREARQLTRLEGFKGYIHDLGGPTANMYGFECKKKMEKGVCQDKRCLFPKTCPSLKPDHSSQIRLLKKLEAVPGIKKVFVGSGVRYDLILADPRHGSGYLDKIVTDHISGQMKIAPEHVLPHVLELMGKPGADTLAAFKQRFDGLSKTAGKKQFLTYYLIAAHPGCTRSDMVQLKAFTQKHLKINPEQVQIFTPTPSTWSTLMYATGKNPFSGRPIFVEKAAREKQAQKDVITRKTAVSKPTPTKRTRSGTPATWGNKKQHRLKRR